MTDAVLALGGQLFGGWTGVTVRRSLEQVAGTFRVDLTERDPGTGRAREMRPGERCEVALGGETVITGHIDSVNVRHGPRSHDIEVAGRDATGDLVDSSAASEPGEWHDQTLEAVATALAAAHNVPVRVEADTAPPFKKFRVEEGETVYEAIERGCRMRGVLPMSDGRGGLVLGRPARDRAAVRLVKGENLRSASGHANWLERHSEYRLLGQRPGNDFLGVEETAHVLATARDAGVSRHRPLTIIAEQALGPDEAQERVQWEADVRAARSRRIVASVRGWRESGDAGALWAPGRLVHITDDWLGLDREMLIAGVQYTLGDEGTRSALTLVPERSFDARAEPEPEEGGSGLWG